MKKITIEDIKKLREKTNAGLMEVKKALQKAEGDFEKAIKWLREKGLANAAKKSDRVAAEGAIFILNKENKVVILELNSETDFVAVNKLFIDFGNKISQYIINTDFKEKSLEEFRKTIFDGEKVDEKIASLTTKLGEKISLRRFDLFDVENYQFATYLHVNKKIGVVVIAKNVEKDLLKDIAMQIAAMNPEYLSLKDVPDDKKEEEYKIAQKDLKDTLKGKPESIQEKIISGKVNKVLSDLILEEQTFVKDNSKKIKQLLSKNAKLISFIRYEVGEGIEKKIENFKDEVMKQIKNKE
ncbi:translation elongation factor Ts [Candidatus Hepatoplasma crinochetorum]|jgi:elongation factor Ts|uniref:translation elongation factor Ts n=1 Tax=Candidatus Hepatoplasma crinochetorum TaxID=295596 RepID=UPI003085C63E|nr:MAG: elongation factor Ts [Candidatus Hepatoplasma crinochetorum]